MATEGGFMLNFMEFGPQTAKIDFGLTFALYYINKKTLITRIIR